MLALESGDYTLSIDPARGGAIMAFAWRGQPIFRPGVGSGILDTASFPLVPFSNRIKNGRFSASGFDVTLQPNFPGSEHPHPLHGFGWLDRWDSVFADHTTAHLTHNHSAPDWPWPYSASQRFTLTDDGLLMELSVKNLGQSQMPCGLGFHPQFPCNRQTRLHALHTAEVIVDDDCLPIGRRQSNGAIDFWGGKPIASRTVDTAYLNRDGPIVIQWPDRGLEAEIEPCPALRHTVIYTPADASFFCAEPVSHTTNSFNASADDSDHVMLEPGEEFAVSCHISARTC